MRRLHVEDSDPCGKVGRCVQRFAPTCGTAGACITGSTAVLRPRVGRCSEAIGRYIIVKTGFNFSKSLSLFSSNMEDNTHTSKQAYVRRPRPSQTTYTPHETKRPQPTRLYEPCFFCFAACRWCVCVVVLFVVDPLLQQYHTWYHTWYNTRSAAMLAMICF